MNIEKTYTGNNLKGKIVLVTDELPPSDCNLDDWMIDEEIFIDGECDIIEYPEYSLRLNMPRLFDWMINQCELQKEHRRNIVIQSESLAILYGLRMAIVRGIVSHEDVLISSRLDDEDGSFTIFPVIDKNARFDMSFPLIDVMSEWYRELMNY